MTTSTPIQITKTSARETVKDIRATLRLIEEALSAGRYDMVRNLARGTYTDIGTLSFATYPDETR